MTTDHKRLIAEARMFAEARGDRRDTTIVNRLADALEAATVERAVVEAQALEQAADAGERLISNKQGGFSHWLRARAAKIRGGQQ